MQQPEARHWRRSRTARSGRGSREPSPCRKAPGSTAGTRPRIRVLRARCRAERVEIRGLADFDERDRAATNPASAADASRARRQVRSPPARSVAGSSTAMVLSSSRPMTSVSRSSAASARTAAIAAASSPSVIAPAPHSTAKSVKTPELRGSRSASFSSETDGARAPGRPEGRARTAGRRASSNNVPRRIAAAPRPVRW